MSAFVSDWNIFLRQNSSLGSRSWFRASISGRRHLPEWFSFNSPCNPGSVCAQEKLVTSRMKQNDFYFIAKLVYKP